MPHDPSSARKLGFASSPQPMDCESYAISPANVASRRLPPSIPQLPAGPRKRPEEAPTNRTFRPRQEHCEWLSRESSLRQALPQTPKNVWRREQSDDRPALVCAFCCSLHSQLSPMVGVSRPPLIVYPKPAHKPKPAPVFGADCPAEQRHFIVPSMKRDVTPRSGVRGVPPAM